VATGAGASPAPDAPAQDKQALEALGKIDGCLATVAKDGDRTILKVAFPNRSNATDAAVARVAAPLKSVSLPVALDLEYCENLTDAGLEPLGSVPNLWSLDLIGNKIADKGLAHLKGAAKLGRLRVDKKTASPTPVWLIWPV